MAERIQTIDSHTGGEPTRVVVAGGPDLGAGTLAERFTRLRNEHDALRRTLMHEPRGSEILVGALLCKADYEDCSSAVIFFNHRGYLGMCGHGMIGVIASLKHLGTLKQETVRIQTPAGVVSVVAHEDDTVSVENVHSYRLREDVRVTVPDHGEIVGDVAYGGNWFFLVKDTVGPIQLDQSRRLTDLALRLRGTLDRNCITGEDGAEIDHIEFFSPPHDPANDSRNFVLCPGGAYDRSPCGTGCSAKLACLAAGNGLAPGELWRQESILGSVFECSYRPAPDGNRIIPTVRGRAFVTGESTWQCDLQDPFRFGIPIGEAGE